ncbi:YgiQ family radical SAM protein [Butyrivibrio sp. WCE2006]|uniref:YgiQ family radical SAM protein n=1 Tax=Butyrivibrio sp. WCE2006 TaxID=1410611 RepID=UPI0009DEE0EA|nr:YgiQ family radical SAM protein [Butyrivibrio sp. WCE2006]
MNKFPPFSRDDLIERGIDQLDFVYVCGDAYVDHSSFGAAIITRTLEAHGYSVGLICQPDFRDENSITVLGTPRLGFLVSAGNMDSMVNHYTVAGKRRKTDAYSPGGEMGRRPDYATIVYCNLIRKVYKHEPIIIGGIEASLRRLGHYDYWSNKVRRSILLDSGADIISYGMGEISIVEIADALASGMAVSDITYINGTVYKTRDEESIYEAIKLPSFEEIKSDKRKYAESFRIQYRNTDPFNGKRLYETYDGSLFVVQNPPSRPLTQQEFDDVYEREYLRAWHPSYDAAGGIPAFDEIKYSLTSNRGCFGECNFCALTFHQGRIVQGRSHESIIREARIFTEEKDFKGYIHDVGGPTAQFRKPACKKQMKFGACPDKKCLHPEVCRNMDVDHSDYLSLLKKLRNLPGVKKVFVRSGIRFDYLLADKDDSFLRELCMHHISGQLRVAPEHISDNVLDKMGKPKVKVYDRFIEKFDRINEQIGKQQYAVPYLMSSHPGSTLKDAIALAEYLCKHRLSPEQVQDFYPTPGTVSTCMYYTGIDPITMEPVYVARDPHEKAMQRALIQFRRPENYELVKEALLRENREDLIGFGPQFLIPPRKPTDKAFGKNANNKNDRKAHTRSGNIHVKGDKVHAKGEKSHAKGEKNTSHKGGANSQRGRNRKKR